MGNMPSLSSILRSRKRSVQRRAALVPGATQSLSPDLTLVDNNCTQSHSRAGDYQTPTIDRKPHGSNSRLLTKAHVLKLRQEANAALDRLEALISSDNELGDAFEPCNVSVSMHLDDLGNSAKALNNILACRDVTASTTANFANLTGKDPSPQVLPCSTDQRIEHRRGAVCLTTPELRSFVEQSSLINEYSSDCITPALVTNRCLHVAPLRLRTRQPPTQSAHSLDSSQIFDTSSPFQNELLALDTQINASSQLSRRYTTDASEQPLHSQRNSRLHTTPWPRPLSLPSSTPMTSVIVEGSSNLDSVEFQPRSGSYQRRQFSTEEKARRLRTIRVSLTTPTELTMASYPGPRDSTEESLCMEELLGFLRQGNSLRDL